MLPRWKWSVGELRSGIGSTGTKQFLSTTCVLEYMKENGLFENPRLWKQRVLFLLRRESDLRWEIALVSLACLILIPVAFAVNYGFEIAPLIGGLGAGLFAAFYFAFILILPRMEAVFSKSDDDDAESEDDDSLRAKYVRGEIDHETFKRRLDEKLGAPADTPTATERDPLVQTTATNSETPDPVTLLRTRYAQGEIDEQEYNQRLATLQKSDEDTDEETELAERN